MTMATPHGIFIVAITFLMIMPAAYRSYDILGVFPTKAVSHFRIGLSLMQGLADAGHNVTMISPYTIESSSNDNPPTKGHIRVVHVAEQSFFTGNDQHIGKMYSNRIFKAVNLLNEGIGSTRHTLLSPAVQALLSARPHFDVIIIEVFLNEALLGLGAHFNAPVIGMSPFGATKLTNDMVGSPAPVAYVPHVTLPLTDRMSLPQRLLNSLTSVGEFLFVNLMYLPAQENLCREIFGEAVPSLGAMQTNVSLVLLNTHYTLNYPRPYAKNMIEVGGLHIRSDPKTRLAPRIQRFLDEAPEAVIYFSMGSNIRSSEMPTDQLNALRMVFTSTKHRVLWKWDNDELALGDLGPNVLVSKWFAQENVLAHPKVKLFITHGGLLSSLEAVYFGVPMIGVPIFGDQHLNVAKAVASGFGLQIRFDNLTESSMIWSIEEIMNNKKYKTQMRLASERFHDQQNHPLDTAIYWVEYVARHRGASHLQSSGRLLSFWVIHNIDVCSVFLLIFLVLVWMLGQVLCRFTHLVTFKSVKLKQR